ncbi:MAG TPA: hypothetical protein VEB19_10925 [Gemmatimonadaceae bacterium]|nr:hypothetical protein [Gemmatimonadaceae bacterium]
MPRREWEKWDHADQVLLEAINEQLNRIVDGAVFIAFQSKRLGLRMSETRLHRKEILVQFENHFRTDVTQLPGWQAVLDVTHDANASKHRAGLHWTEAGNGMARLLGTVQMERETITRRFTQVGKWLRAFGSIHNLP